MPVRLIMVLTEDQPDEAREQHNGDGQEEVWVWNLDRFRTALRKELEDNARTKQTKRMVYVRKRVWELALEAG